MIDPKNLPLKYKKEFNADMVYYKSLNIPKYTFDDLKLLGEILSESHSGGNKIEVSESNVKIVLHEHFGKNADGTYLNSWVEKSFSLSDLRYVIAAFLKEYYRYNTCQVSVTTVGFFYYYILPFENIKILNDVMLQNKEHVPHIRCDLIDSKDMNTFIWRIKINK